MARLDFVIRLNSVDFPTLGRPTMTMVGETCGIACTVALSLAPAPRNPIFCTSWWYQQPHPLGEVSITARPVTQRRAPTLFWLPRRLSVSALKVYRRVTDGPGEPPLIEQPAALPEVN